MFREQFGDISNKRSRSVRLNDLLGRTEERDMTERRLKTLVPDVAISFAIGYLTERAKEDRPPEQVQAAGLARAGHVAAAMHDGLRDVMLTIGFAMGDEPQSDVEDDDIDRTFRLRWSANGVRKTPIRRSTIFGSMCSN